MKIGPWLHEQLKRLKTHDDDIYKKLSLNEHVKKSMDIFLTKKNEGVTETDDWKMKFNL